MSRPVSMLVAIAVGSLFSWGCAPYPSSLDVLGDASLIGAMVIVDGAPVGTVEVAHVQEAWLAWVSQYDEGWPGQAKGDTVFAAGSTRGDWFGKVSGGKHVLVLRNADGRELRLALSTDVDVTGVLASFSRNSIHSWVESY